MVFELVDMGWLGLGSGLMEWCCSSTGGDTSRKDGSQDAFVNLPFHGCLVDLWRRIIVSVSRIKAVSPFYSIAACDSGCEIVGGGFVASACMLSRP